MARLKINDDAKNKKLVEKLNLAFGELAKLEAELVAAEEAVKKDHAAVTLAAAKADETFTKAEQLVAEMHGLYEECARVAGEADEVIAKADQLCREAIDAGKAEVTRMRQLAETEIEAGSKQAKDAAALVFDELAKRETAVAAQEEKVAAREAKLAEAQKRLDAKALALASSNGKKSKAAVTESVAVVEAVEPPPVPAEPSTPPAPEVTAEVTPTE